MGTIITVKSNCYTFLLDGKRVYLKMPGNLQQQFLLEKNYNEKRMPDEDYVVLMDSIYRHRIKDTASLQRHVYDNFSLTTSTRKF